MGRRKESGIAEREAERRASSPGGVGFEAYSVSERLWCLGVIGRDDGVVCPFAWGACSILRVLEPGREAQSKIWR